MPQFVTCRIVRQYVNWDAMSQLTSRSALIWTGDPTILEMSYCHPLVTQNLYVDWLVVEIGREIYAACLNQGVFRIRRNLGLRFGSFGSGICFATIRSFSRYCGYPSRDPAVSLV